MEKIIKPHQLTLKQEVDYTIYLLDILAPLNIQLAKG